MLLTRPPTSLFLLLLLNSLTQAVKWNSGLTHLMTSASQIYDVARSKLSYLKRLSPNLTAEMSLKKWPPYFSERRIFFEYCRRVENDENKSGDSQTVTSSSSFLFSDLYSEESEIVLNQHDRRRRLEYMGLLAATFGMPTLTWLPESIGSRTLENSPMSLHLEPSSSHLSEALMDILSTYSYNLVAIIVSKNVPGYEDLIYSMKSERVKRSSSEHPKFFKLEITQEILYEGVSSRTDAVKCFKKKKKIGNMNCFEYYANILHQILVNDDRVIVFHGSLDDLNLLHKIGTSDKRYERVFGSEIVWFTTPHSFTNIVPAMFKENIEFSKGMEFFAYKGVSGLFGIDYFVLPKDLNLYINISWQVWSKAMSQLVDFVSQKYDLSRSEAMEKVTPRINCSTNDGIQPWHYGRYLYNLMKNVTVEMVIDNEVEYLGFDERGYLNYTKFVVMNSKKDINSNNKWQKVGSWERSSRYGKLHSKLRIDGVTWPGDSNIPPKGRPAKFILKVGTLAEEPFVRYTKTQETGLCDPNSLPCKVRLEKNQSIDSIPSSGNIEIMDSVPLPRDYNFTLNMTKACCSGMTIDLLKELMKDLNFDVDIFEAPDKRTGDFERETGWNGLVGELVSGNADIVTTAFKMSPNRSEIIDFSIPFQETGIAIVMALREGAISATAFLKPYDFMSWLVILLFSVHACGAAIFIYEWLSPVGLDRGNVPPREHRFSLFRSFWLIWSMLFGAAVNADNPRGVASRFLASIWALFALVFLASYTANLAAFMIAKEEVYSIKGIEDEKLQNPYSHKPMFRFATVPNSATEKILTLSFPHMTEYMKRFNKSSVEEGIKALKIGELDAFIYDANVLEYKAVHDDTCRLRVVSNWYGMSGYAIGFSKGSKWLKPVNEKILSYQKNGKLQRWKKFWLAGACKKTQELGNSNKTLGVKNFISAFILLLSGMIFCILLLATEHIFFWYMRPKLGRCDKYGCCGLISISVGQLLSFEQSVNQTVDMVKHHKCRNPICQTQMWKARHELDQAQLKVKRLESSLRKLQTFNSTSKQGLSDSPYSLLAIEAKPPDKKSGGSSNTEYNANTECYPPTLKDKFHSNVSYVSTPRSKAYSTEANTPVKMAESFSASSSISHDNKIAHLSDSDDKSKSMEKDPLLDRSLCSRNSHCSNSYNSAHNSAKWSTQSQRQSEDLKTSTVSHSPIKFQHKSNCPNHPHNVVRSKSSYILVEKESVV